MEGTQPLDILDRLLEDRRLNTTLAWLLTGFVALVAVHSAVVGELLWGVFAGAVLALVLVPPIAHRDPLVMLPWEVLVLATLPLLGRTLDTAILPPNVATYLSVAALALVVAVELHVFTPVRMNAWFAVLFVVVTTMATAGVWAVVQWVSDLYLETQFILDPALTEAEQEARVMWSFVAATGVGLVAGILFDRYFRRLARVETRLSMDATGGGDG